MTKTIRFILLRIKKMNDNDRLKLKKRVSGYLESRMNEMQKWDCTRDHGYYDRGMKKVLMKIYLQGAVDQACFFYWAVEYMLSEYKTRKVQAKVVLGTLENVLAALKDQSFADNEIFKIKGGKR